MFCSFGYIYFQISWVVWVLYSSFPNILASDINSANSIDKFATNYILSIWISKQHHVKCMCVCNPYLFLVQAKNLLHYNFVHSKHWLDSFLCTCKFYQTFFNFQLSISLLGSRGESFILYLCTLKTMTGFPCALTNSTKHFSADFFKSWNFYCVNQWIHNG